MDESRSKDYPLRRRDVVSSLLHQRGDMLLVSGLGAATWDVTAAGDSPLTFPLWGAMGGAVCVGLGLALARPTRRVLVITGDGEMLMALGSLATVAIQQPQNLSIVVLDNERYGETGMQLTHTAGGVDLTAVAAGTGISNCHTVRNTEALQSVRSTIRNGVGPVFCTVKVRAESLPRTLPPKDGVYLKERFRHAITESGPDGGIV
jgi:thiamine pyrophosphate-dependent acetolactate synthase large subunit-like protein